MIGLPPKGSPAAYLSAVWLGTSRPDPRKAAQFLCEYDGTAPIINTFQIGNASATMNQLPDPF